jgi:hypothetical protein
MYPCARNLTPYFNSARDQPEDGLEEELELMKIPIPDESFYYKQTYKYIESAPHVTIVIDVLMDVLWKTTTKRPSLVLVPINDDKDDDEYLYNCRDADQMCIFPSRRGSSRNEKRKRLRGNTTDRTRSLNVGKHDKVLKQRERRAADKKLSIMKGRR